MAVVLTLAGLAVVFVASIGGLFLPLRRSPWPDLITIGDAVLPILVLAKLGHGRYDTGQIVTQGILWGVVAVTVTHILRVKFTPRAAA